MPKEKSFKTASQLLAAVLGAAALTAVGVVAAQDTQDSNDGQSPGTVASTPTATASPEIAQRQVYIAQLLPANGSGVTGTAKFVVDSGNAGVSIDASGLSPSMRHPQHVHAGTQCPGANADANSDGWVDVKEAEAIAGQSIIPLSLNLSQQAGALPATQTQNFPVASENGILSYIQSMSITSFGTLPTPTTSPTGISSPGLLPTATASPSESPSITPSPAESPTFTPTATPAFSPTPTESPEILSLANRVVELHGMDVSLPSTVQSDQNLPANETLPVACGVLVRVAE